jgi:two-component system OmpR family response regulator
MSLEPAILLIDDDAELGAPLKSYFARFGLHLTQALTPSSGLNLLRGGAFQALILDVMLPEMSGFEVCKSIRQEAGSWSQLPILMLTARGEVTDRVVGLELGADDYLPKPFEPRELVARIQTALRRQTAIHHAAASISAAAHTLHFENLQIDTAKREVQVHSKTVDLTSAEFDLLLILAKAAGGVVSRDEILNQLRGIEADIYSRAVDILVSRLRKRLEPLDAIKTIRNAGYSLALASASPTSKTFGLS